MNGDAQKVRSIFLTAVEKHTPEQWGEYLDHACAGKEELRCQVEVLLRAHEQPNSLLDRPTPALAVTAEEVVSERPGTVLGAYKLLEQIGEGGFGVVFLAEQTEPIRRKVALKVIKPGMDTKQVVARFEAERQALALMDHPNIAHVYDGGATDSGRPFFVMELVKGAPITDFCDQNHLSIRQRLELFVSVCSAVQHAHQKGIIHRDLKPSNILATVQDGTPVAKVIDFGIAKATGRQLTDRTLFTGQAQLIGTPLYMSPEQAQLSSLDIDTRSDIYSLGVLLYELLTGATPFDQERLQRVGFDEIRRIIREEEPARPSMRMSTLGQAAAAVSANRESDPRALSRLFRGELDWIVMKALAKDRSRRYETANSFAMDVQRYLADEPVQACPPTVGYRLRTFVRRNRAALAVACVVAGALVMAIVGLAVSNWLVASERDQKAQALSDKEKALASERVALGKAEASELLARRRYYAAQMNLAMQAWRAGEVPRVLELLEGQRPKAGEEDLRGFEWFYLWRLCNGGRRLWLNGHTRAVMSLAFSPDGMTLASASWDRTVRLWDTLMGRERLVLRGHARGPWWVAFSPDGKTLASGGDETGALILWDASTGKPLHTIPLSIAGLAFSPDGKVLAAGAVASDGIHAKLWDVATGTERAALKDAGIVVAYLPGGKRLVTLTGRFSEDSQVQVWDVEAGVKRLSIPAPGLLHAAVSSDGTRLATASKTPALWDLSTGRRLLSIADDSNLRALAFSPDGKKLATGSEYRTVKLWDVETGRRLGQEVHLDPVWTVAFSPDGKTLASATLGGAIKLWDMTPAEEATTLTVERLSVGRFSPDGKTLVAGTRDRTKVIDVAAGKEIAMLPASNVVAISADANVLAAKANRDEYDLWDVRAGRKVATIPVPQLTDVAPRLTLSPDGKMLAGFSRWRGQNTVTLWDVAARQSRALKPPAPGSNALSVICAEFSPDGRLLAVGYQFQWVTVWDVTTGAVKLQFSQPPSMMNVYSVAFSPDGKTLAVGADVGAVTLWDVDTGNRLVALRGHTSSVYALAFSPDGQTLATAGADKTVRLWDVITGQERATLTGHGQPVGGVLFSPDGYTLATGSADGTVKLWRGATDPEALAPRSDRVRGRLP